jgi:hypothetical protein
MQNVYLVRNLHTNIFDYMSTPKKMWKIFFDKELTDRFGVYSTKAQALQDIATYNFKVVK